MEDSNYIARSRGIINSNEFTPINVIGCGSIGSYATLALAKMGAKEFNLYDNDKVEDVNIGTQAFTERHLGFPKVRALESIIEENVKNPIINTFQNKVCPDTQIPKNITIIGVDSMLSRAEIFQNIKFNVPLFIDGRIGGEMVRIFSVKDSGNDIKKYQKSLYTDDEAMDLPCTERSVADIGFIVGAFIARNVRYYLKEKEVKNELIFDTVTMGLVQT